MNTSVPTVQRFSLLLKIGRVSNLPTVWTNVLAGACLAGLHTDLPQLLWVMLAITLFSTGGMYLNDAFDADIDARERPSRPIPSGQISAKSVSAMGCAMLMAGAAHKLCQTNSLMGPAGPRSEPAGPKSQRGACVQVHFSGP